MNEWIICPRCQGEGTICTVTEHGMTSGEWNEFTTNDQDYELIEAYLDGAYNKTCPLCEGNGKLKEADSPPPPTGEDKFLQMGGIC